MKTVTNMGLLGAALVTAKASGLTALPWVAVTAPYWGPMLIGAIAGLLAKAIRGINARIQTSAEQRDSRNGTQEVQGVSGQGAVHTRETVREVRGTVPLCNPQVSQTEPSSTGDRRIYYVTGEK